MIFEKHETYDKLKFLALLVVPLGTFISTLLNIWGLPFADQIMASFAALDLFIGAVVVASKKAYDKQQIGSDEL